MKVKLIVLLVIIIMVTIPKLAYGYKYIIRNYMPYTVTVQVNLVAASASQPPAVKLAPGLCATVDPKSNPGGLAGYACIECCVKSIDVQGIPGSIPFKEYTLNYKDGTTRSSSSISVQGFACAGDLNVDIKPKDGGYTIDIFVDSVPC